MKYRQIHNFSSHFPKLRLCTKLRRQRSYGKKEKHCNLSFQGNGHAACNRTTGTVEDELANWPMMCSQLRKRMAGCKVEHFHFRIAPHSTVPNPVYSQIGSANAKNTSDCPCFACVSLVLGPLSDRSAKFQKHAKGCRPNINCLGLGVLAKQIVPVPSTSFAIRTKSASLHDGERIQ